MLSLSCHSGWILNGHLVVKTLTFCLELYGTGGNGTKAAALATCSQAIMQYCKAMGELSLESAMALVSFSLLVLITFVNRSL